MVRHIVPLDWWRRIFDACGLVRLLGTNRSCYACYEAHPCLADRGVDGIERAEIDRDGAAVARLPRRAGLTLAMTSLQPSCWGRAALIRTSPCRLGGHQEASTTSPGRSRSRERRGTEVAHRRFLSRREFLSSGAKRTSPSQVGRHIAIANSVASCNVTLAAWLVTADVTFREEYASDEICEFHQAG